MSVPEIWKPIPGYEGRYEASSLGQIRSLPNKRRKTILILKQQPHCRTGYLFINLTSHNGKRWFQKGHWVARLICAAFHGPSPAAGLEACHGDGNHQNNAEWNLRWDTHAGNEADKAACGTDNLGARNGRAILNEEKVRGIKTRIAAGEHSKPIAADYGVAHTTIKAIKNGENWGHIHV